MATTDFFFSPFVWTTVAFLVGFLITRMLRRAPYRPPPGPPGLPFVGNFFTFAFAGAEQNQLLNKWAKKYGDVYQFTLFGTRFVTINDYKLAKEVLTSDDVQGRAPILPCNKALGRPNTGLGILGTDGERGWKDIRKLTQNVLRSVAMVTKTDGKYEQLVANQAEKHIQKLFGFNGSYFNPADDIYVNVANVTSAFLLGKTYDYDDKEFVQLLHLTRDLFDCMAAAGLTYHIPFLSHLPTATNRKMVNVVKKQFDFYQKIIQQHRNSLNLHIDDGSFKSLVEVFLKEQHQRHKEEDIWPFDDTNLLQTTFDLAFAGFETTSTLIRWHFLMMAQHPDVQARVQAELNEVTDRDHMPKFSDHSRCPYTLATLLETYRLSGAIPSHLPRRVRKDMKVQDYDIQKGSWVSLNAGWLAMSPDVWGDPDKFRPERFLDESGALDYGKEAKLGRFGFGRRLCVGEQLARTELFIFTTHIMHRFTLQLREGTPISLEGRSGLIFEPLPFELRAIPRP